MKLRNRNQNVDYAPCWVCVFKTKPDISTFLTCKVGVIIIVSMCHLENKLRCVTAVLCHCYGDGRLLLNSCHHAAAVTLSINSIPLWKFSLSINDPTTLWFKLNCYFLPTIFCFLYLAAIFELIPSSFKMHFKYIHSRVEICPWLLPLSSNWYLLSIVFHTPDPL